MAMPEPLLVAHEPLPLAAGSCAVTPLTTICWPTVVVPCAGALGSFDWQPLSVPLNVKVKLESVLLRPGEMPAVPASWQRAPDCACAGEATVTATATTSNAKTLSLLDTIPSFRSSPEGVRPRGRDELTDLRAARAPEGGARDASSTAAKAGNMPQRSE